MKKILSVLALSAAAASASADISYDFTPTVQDIFCQDIIVNDEHVTQVRIEVKFDDEVWWVSGFSGQCYLLDKNGNKYEEWTRDFSGPSSDYSKFYFGINGLNKYEDADYTLVIPQGLMGNPVWQSGGQNAGSSGRANPELRYEFNAWKLAGEPREDKTVYDFTPTSWSSSLEEVRINGQKTLELQLSLEFPEAIAIHEKIENKWNVAKHNPNASDPMDEYEHQSDAILRAWVDENNPNKAIIGLRGVDLKISVDYRISIWTGGFGTLTWAAEDYCESHASPELVYTVNPKGTSAVENLRDADTGEDAIFNLQGVRMNAGKLAKGIYIRDGKKFVVK